MSYLIDVQTAAGLSQLPGNQPTSLVTFPVDPVPVVEGSVYYNVSVGMFVFGSRIDGTPTWVPLPTSFTPSTSTGRTVDFSMDPVTVFPTDYIISVDCSGGSMTLYLPDPANVTPWKQFIIKDASGNAGDNHVIIAAEPATIDGAASFVLDTNYQSVALYCDGTDYFIWEGGTFLLPNPIIASGISAEGLDTNFEIDADPTKIIVFKKTCSLQGGQILKRTSVDTATYTVLDTDLYLGVNTLTAPLTITLPPIASTVGQVFTIKDEDAGAVNFPITIEGDSGETIDGVATLVLSQNYQSVQLLNNGTQWSII